MMSYIDDSIITDIFLNNITNFIHIAFFNQSSQTYFIPEFHLCAIANDNYFYLNKR